MKHVLTTTLFFFLFFLFFSAIAAVAIQILVVLVPHIPLWLDSVIGIMIACLLSNIRLTLRIRW